MSGIVFGARNLSAPEIKGKKVIEIGSYDINGSLRSIVESMEPAEYVGVDLEEGPGVDIICDAEKIVDKFGSESFDVVISTELLEHIKDWRKVISNIKTICKEGGLIFITTRSFGFAYHGHPYDFWRFESEDMENIFSDCEILALENDDSMPGIFMKAQKPYNFHENNLSDYKLYNIIADKRCMEITDNDLKSFHFKFLVLRYRLKNLLNKIIIYTLSKI